MNQENVSFLDQLIEVLGSKNCQLTSTEIADILWLTGQIHQGKNPDEGKFSISKQEHKEEVEPTLTPLPPNFPTPAKVALSPPKVEILPKTVSSGKASLTVKAPDASSLGNSLNLARSLRPLIQRCGTQKKDILDETATVERMARFNGLPLPIFTSRQQAWLDLVLMVDESQSMVFWQSTTQELKSFFKHYGIFRDVELWKLKPLNGEKSFEIYRDDHSKKPFQPKALIDPSGRRLILIVSDGVMG